MPELCTGRVADDMLSRGWTDEYSQTAKSLVSKVGARVPDCSGVEPKEAGHWAKGEFIAHLAYSDDGFYIFAGACFAKKMFEAAGGIA